MTDRTIALAKFTHAHLEGLWFAQPQYRDGERPYWDELTEEYRLVLLDFAEKALKEIDSG